MRRIWEFEQECLGNSQMNRRWQVGACFFAGVMALGCAQTGSLARKEKLPASLLQAATGATRTDYVKTVLRSDIDRETNNAPPDRRGEQVPPNGMAEQTIAPVGAVSADGLVAAQGVGASNMVDQRIQYASLTEPAADEPGIPALPESIPPSPAPAAVSLPNTVSGPLRTGKSDEADRVARMRTLAERIAERMPDRLDEFMREVRLGAAQGNWDAVMASWSVDLEFASRVAPTDRLTLSPARPSEHRVSSLTDALKRDLPETRNSSSASSDEYSNSSTSPARVTSVATKNVDANELPMERSFETSPTSLSGTGSNPSRVVPYRPVTDGPTLGESRERRSGPIDFVSLAEQATNRSPGEGSDPFQWKVYGRLLYAMAGERERALAPIEGMDSADRRFWRSYVYALDRYFDEDGHRRPSARATQAAVALRESVDALAERADLEITDPIFCKAVHSFGHFEEFDRYEFRAGEGVVVYWEARQFVSAESADGYRTRMKAEFEIVDSQGNRRHRFEQKFKDDVCRRKRSDYFNVVVFEWPSDLTPGDYSLRVTVTDLQSDKIAEKRQSFRIIR